MAPSFRILMQSILIFSAAVITAEAQPTFVAKVPDASTRFSSIGGLAYFTSHDSLFRTDGTTAGTIFLKSGFNFFGEFMEFEDLLIFIVIRPQAPREIWRSDGTAAGTYFLQSSPCFLDHLPVFGVAGGYFYFAAADAVAGCEIFRSDGTAAGTFLLKDINPGGASNSEFPKPLAAVGDYFYFSANDGVHGTELWKTDGSASGTVMVKDINPGADAGVVEGRASSFNNRLYFTGINPETGAEPWVSDGTAVGTVLLKDLIPGEDFPGTTDFSGNLAGSLYFFSSRIINPDSEYFTIESDLWVTDGTAERTIKLRSFQPCALCTFTGGYFIFSSRYYFFINERDYEGNSRDILYASDGTPTGTVPVYSLGASGGTLLGDIDEHLYFYGIANYSQNPLYQTDGTLAGTEIVRSFNSITSTPYIEIVKIGDKLYFPDHDAPYDPAGGYDQRDLFQLMQYDGSTARSIRSMGGGSYAGSGNLLHMNDLLIFTSNDFPGNEMNDGKVGLWVLDPSKPIESRGTFTLVNADTDDDIQTLNDGDVVTLSNDSAYNIRFDPPGTPGSVVFKHQDNIVRRENAAPYSLAGDRSGDYVAWSQATPGRHLIEAIPFSEAGGQGTPGLSRAISFTIQERVTACNPSGTVLREFWSGIQGTQVSLIPVESEPDGTSQLTVLEGPRDVGINYGARIRGYICPPATGDYIFWIASNDHSELWVSIDEEPSNRRRVAYLTRATDFRQWNKFATQRSSPITLMQGKRYYIEALHKQGIGTDHVSVGWQLPNGTMERPIGANRLSPFGEQSDVLSHLILPATGSSGIDPLVVKLESRIVDGASRYTVEVNSHSDFTGESKIVTSAEDNQNIFIIKDLNSATTYYARVKTDVTDFGPVTTFTTRNPISRLRLWGLASYGGANNVGTIFSYSITDNSFVKHYDQPVDWDGYSNEERLIGTLVPGPDGVFYGHREENYGAAMFELNSQGHVDWWGGLAYFEKAQLSLASNNHIYATNDDSWVPGVVDKYDIENETLILDARMDFFSHISGANTPLIELNDGYFYGAAGQGGVAEGGYLYRFRLDGTGFQTLNYFYDLSTGMKPEAGLLEYNGLLYGTTTHGGEYGSHGTIFKIRPDGTEFSKLHDFNGINGSDPRAELIVMNDVLYGTTNEGGAAGMGTVFSINPEGTGYSVLHSFSGADGARPSRGLVHDRNGILYGMTSNGGSGDMGVIYKVSTSGSGFSKLFDFTQSSGGRPTGALVIREDTYSPSSTLASEIVDDQMTLGVSIYPNPTSDNFEVTVASPNKAPIRMVVMDQYGQNIKTYDVPVGTTMQIGDDLKKGFYIMKMIKDDAVTMYRLVKK